MAHKKKDQPGGVRILYACTHITKDVAVDHFVTGAEVKQTCVLDQRCNITGRSLTELLAALGEVYCLTIDDVFIADQGAGRVDWISFNRMENADGAEPTEGQLAAWKRGEVTLYLADYSFAIEKRVVAGVPKGDFEFYRIKTH